MNASAEGSLYELVARGNKDVFFYGDQVNSKYIFDNTYEAQSPFLEEVRRVPPKTSSEFGRTVEFDIDVVGDFMKNPAILISLPTWLPELYAKSVKQSTITDASGLSYGYIKGIAYFLFETISFYQDNILLQEFSGDALWAIEKISGTYGRKFITSKEAGEHDGSSVEIGWNAAPGQLRLELPILGCQNVTDNGFPQRATTRHTYRLRCKLRRIEDLVESSDPNTLKKAEPWNRVMTIKRSATDSGIQFTTLSRSSLQPLKLEFETTQVYVDMDVQRKMEEMPISVRFNRIYTNHFTQNQLDYAGVIGGGISMVNRRLDGRHPSGRILWFFRAADDINANRLYKINTVTNSSYYNSLTFLIAGQTRESPRTATIWRDLTNFAKEDIDSGLEINTMNWSFGAIAPKRFSDELTAGSVNFSTADKPTLYIDLARPGSLTTSPSTELIVIVEGLCEFKTDGKGRAELLSMN